MVERNLETKQHLVRSTKYSVDVTKICLSLLNYTFEYEQWNMYKVAWTRHIFNATAEVLTYVSKV